MTLPAFAFKASLQLFAVFLIADLFTACHNSAQISKVELATGFCEGACQPTAVLIDSSLNYFYYGDTITPFLKLPGDQRDDRIEGYYEGRISKELWKAITAKLNQIDFQDLDSLYQRSVDDQRLEIIVHYQGKVKHIRAQSSSLPDTVRKVFYWIAESYKHEKLTPTEDSSRFETYLHNYRRH